MVNFFNGAGLVIASVLCLSWMLYSSFDNNFQSSTANGGEQRVVDFSQRQARDDSHSSIRAKVSLDNARRNTSADMSLWAPSKRMENPLQQFATRHTQGPVLWKWHEYFEAYHANFFALRARGQVRMLLIGVNTGGDLFMFRDYFGSDCRIYGVDLNPEVAAFSTEDNIKMYVGSQDDAAFLKMVGDEVGGFDIILDDASHVPQLTLTTLKHLWPYVNEDGVYMIEDLQKQQTVSEMLARIAGRLPLYCKQTGKDEDVLPCSEVHRISFLGGTAAAWKGHLGAPGNMMYGDMRLPYEGSASRMKNNGAGEMKRKFHKVYTGKESRLAALDMTIDVQPSVTERAVPRTSVEARKTKIARGIDSTTQAAGVSAGRLAAEERSDKASKSESQIVLATFSDNKFYYPYAEKINQMYARRWGYAVKLHHTKQLEYHPSWEKVALINQYLADESVTAVLSLDYDAFVNKHERSVESYLDKHADKDVIMGYHTKNTEWAEARMQKGHQAINAGVMIVRNTAWSRKFFQDLLHQSFCEYNSTTCCWEQDCMRETLARTDEYSNIAQLRLQYFNCNELYDEYLGKCDPYVWHQMGPNKSALELISAKRYRELLELSINRKPVSGAVTTMGRRFVRYVSSTWEQLWLDNIEQWQNKQICEVLAQQQREVLRFVNATCAVRTNTPWCVLDDAVKRIWWNTESGEYSRSPPPTVMETGPVTGYGVDDPAIFSHFEYENTDGTVDVEYIEPLVGQLRHPLAGCGTADRNRLFGTHRSFVIPPAHTARQGDGGSGGEGTKALRFDAGASSWSDGLGGPSLSFFTEVWGRHGIEFDYIEAWDGGTAEAEFDATVPAAYRARTHFHQQWVSPTAKEKPFVPTVIRNAAQRNDYVVFKLDIDNGAVEMGIVRHLLSDDNDDDEYVDEFVWEHHVDNYLMNRWWKDTINASMSIADSYGLFLRMRRKGIRAHSWV
eukprot:m.1084671 g.1084671  ORF g.1084671 m.1084671 type:complete len:957 (-) comp24274_c0_seq5:1839-4709(-)